MSFVRENIALCTDQQREQSYFIQRLRHSFHCTSGNGRKFEESKNTEIHKTFDLMHIRKQEDIEKFNKSQKKRK